MGAAGDRFEQAEDCQDRLGLVFAVDQRESPLEKWPQVLSVLGQSLRNLRNSKQGHVAEFLGHLIFTFL